MNNIELQIGGIIIDRQYSIWLHLWNELFENILKKSDYDYFFVRIQMDIHLIIQKKIVCIYI